MPLSQDPGHGSRFFAVYPRRQIQDAFEFSLSAIFHSSIGDKRLSSFTNMAVISSEGRVSYIPPIIVNAVCKFDYTFYPYDEQDCEIKIGSWHHDGGMVT
jgi:hypothetical protein